MKPSAIYMHGHAMTHEFQGRLARTVTSMAWVHKSRMAHGTDASPPSRVASQTSQCSRRHLRAVLVIRLYERRGAVGTGQAAVSSDEPMQLAGHARATAGIHPHPAPSRANTDKSLVVRAKIAQRSVAAQHRGAAPLTLVDLPALSARHRGRRTFSRCSRSRASAQHGSCSS